MNARPDNNTAHRAPPTDNPTAHRAPPTDNSGTRTPTDTSWSNDPVQAERLFDQTQLQYDEQVQQLSGVAPRILVVGPSGTGKSTLINNIFGLSGASAAATRASGRPCTDGFHQYGPFPDRAVRLIDSRGIEREAAPTQRLELVNYIAEARNGPVSDHVHVAWYLPSERWQPSDIEFITALRTVVKVLVVISKCDTDMRNQLAGDDGADGMTAKDVLRTAILHDFPGMEVFFCGDPRKNEQGWEPETCSRGHPSAGNFVLRNRTRTWECNYESDEGAVCGETGVADTKLFGYIELSRATAAVLPSAIADAFVYAQQVDMLAKLSRATDIITEGVLASVGVAAIPIPFSDWPLLVVVEARMAAQLFLLFSIPTSVMDVGTFAAVNVATVGSVGFVAKLSAAVMKGSVVGAAIGGVVDSAVAAVACMVLGIAITQVCLVWDSETDDGGEEGKFRNLMLRVISKMDVARLAGALLEYARTGQREVLYEAIRSGLGYTTRRADDDLTLD